MLESVRTIDLVVLVTYVVATRVGFGWWAARRARGGGAEGYFLAGRDLKWPLIGLSFYVANMSGSTFVGLPASGYHDGIAVYNYEWLPAIILILFAFFVLPSFVRLRVYTAPQYLEERFGRSVRSCFAVFLLLANLFIDAAAALYAGATIVSVLIPDVPLTATIWVSALVSGLYILYGGLGAVVINDAVQAGLILAGGAAISVLAYRAIPSWSELAARAPAETLSLIRPVTDPELPWPGLFTGVLIVGIYFWCVNQFVIQRALGAKNLDHARRGALFAGLLKLPNLFLLVLPGVMATALYPDLDSPDLVFPTLAFDLLPVGLRGLMLAALAAAILSSLEAILNSASTLFTMDVVRGVRPDLEDDTLVKIGRIATIAFMVAAASWAPRISEFPTLWQYLQSILSYVTPPVVAVFATGLFWRRANRAGALATLAVGVPLGAGAWYVNEIVRGGAFPFLYAGGIMLVVSLAIGATVTWLTPPPDPERVARASWRPDDAVDRLDETDGGRWYRDARVLAAALALLTASIVVAWW